MAERGRGRYFLRSSEAPPAEGSGDEREEEKGTSMIHGLTDDGVDGQHMLSAPLSTAGSSTQTGRRSRPSSVRSSRTLTQEVEYELEERATQIADMESEMEGRMKAVDAEISHASDLIQEFEKDLADESVSSDKSYIHSRIRHFKEVLRDLNLNKKKLQVQQEVEMAKLSRQKALLISKAKLEQSRLQDIMEQQLGSDENSSGDGAAGGDFGAGADRSSRHKGQWKLQTDPKWKGVENLFEDKPSTKNDEELANVLQELEGLKFEAEESARKLKVKKEDANRRMAKLNERNKVFQEPMKTFGKIKTEPKRTAGPTASVTTGDERLIELFARAINSHAPNAAGGAQDNSKFLARQTAKELPTFTGNAEEWPIFYSAFERTTRDCGFSNSENMDRLQRCLKGDAARYIRSMMVAPDNVPQIMDHLKIRYGQPEHIIRAMIEKAKSVPAVKMNELGTLIEFGVAVMTFTNTVKTLQRPQHLSNPQLQYELEQKLPEGMRMTWMKWLKKDPNRERDLDNFSVWLNEETAIACELCPVSSKESESVGEPEKIEKAEKTKKKVAEKSKQADGKEVTPTAAGLFVGERSRCIFCGKHFDSTLCRLAERMPLEDKRKIVRDLKACYNCLRPDHWARDCMVKVNCNHCQKPHPTCMCGGLENARRNSEGRRSQKKMGFSTFDSERNDNAEKSKVKSETKKTVHFEQPCTSSAQTTLACQSDVLLKTIKVKVFSQDGKTQITARLLFDDAAQHSYITSAAVKRIGSKPKGQESARNLLFDGTVTEYQTINIHSITIGELDGLSKRKLTLREKPVIGGRIPRVPKGPWIKDLADRGIHLSDYSAGHSQPSDIDVLVGSDYWGYLMKGNMVHLGAGLIAMESIFGWTLSGPLVRAEGFSFETVALLSMVETVSQIWNLDAIGIRDPIEVKSKQEEERKAKDHFAENVYRLEDGRYSVRLPWIDGVQKLPTNKFIAERRLISTTRKLIDKGLLEVYDDIIKSWIAEGFVEIVDNSEDSDCHYLPHHPVFKESVTTPVRPVFDASCKSQRNPSLNDCLYKGPNLLELIPSVLLRFRERRIGVIGDIRKAFQMIDVQQQDREYLRFLWWKDLDRKGKLTLRHKRVVFGVNSSPFLLAAVLEMHLKSIQDNRKPLAEKLLKALYVDNCVTSVDSQEEYEDFKKTWIQMLAEAQMELRQWESNEEEVSGAGPLNSRGCRLDTDNMGKTDYTTMVLGLVWDKVGDSLSCHIKVSDGPDKITKRTVLSQIHKIFDPIGFTCPTVLQPKLLLQRIWESKIGWDTELPQEECDKFRKWCADLHHLRDIKIPRQIFSQKESEIQIHTFCDASQDAYAAVVFLRSDERTEVKVQLMQAKARVSPLKKPTIPRLELMACLIGTRLTMAVKEALGMENVVTFYWTDATTALQWIKSNDEWGTFVGNRVKEILKYTEAKNWRHVKGELNPADLPSRGCSFRKLLSSAWWEGPGWLKSSQEEWPVSEVTVDKEEVDKELKKTVAVKLTTTVAEDRFWKPKFSSYRKNVAVYGWIRRFCSNSKLKVQDRITSEYLTIEEMRKAEKDLLKEVQKEAFPEKISSISGIPVIKGSDGLIRIKTKLLYREDTEEFRWPILLSKDHAIVHQLIRDVHLAYDHAGVQFVMGILRLKYWILQSRKVIGSIIHKCTRCRRFDSKSLVVDPAALPQKRVSTSEPFATTGVDLAGPLTLRNNKKVWIVLFTCAVYRGVHLDLVDSLSTEAFLQALERFVNLYGRPNTIYSDNGTNFVGAVNIFKKLDWRKIERMSNAHQIQWIFNPPTAAWWGGWWERLVRTMKDLLRRNLGKARLTFDELRTCLTSASAVINDRPLTLVTEDFEDLIPLTPAMFIRGSRSFDFPEGLKIKSTDLQSQYKRNKILQKQLQDRFRKEYLSQLVQKANTRSSPMLKVGDVVFVGSDNRKRFDWPIGIIVELFPGKDDVERVAKVKTKQGILSRPLQRLYPMEVHTAEDIPQDMVKVAKESSKMKTRENRDSSPEQEQKTRTGRIIRKPSRYGEWNN